MNSKNPTAQSALDQDQKRTLVAAARAAAAKAFLTKDGGVRYGAAVLTTSGATYSAGQYSSFNHSTNVHAEQASLVIAAMSGDADVVALAVASTGRDSVTRPCGVCRQVMLEHAQRIGRDFLVLMGNQENGWEEQTVSDLIPYSWSANSQSDTAHRMAGSTTRTCQPQGGRAWQPDLQINTGDHLLLSGGVMALVWDPLPWPDQLLVKIKYRQAADGAWMKLPHALTESMAYERELMKLGGLGSVPCGAPVACVSSDAIERVYPCLPAPELPPVLADCLRRSGISHEHILLSGSRSTGMGIDGSDYDLVVRATVNEATDLRQRLGERLLDGRLRIPKDSGSWRYFTDLYPGGREAILRARAFAETVEEQSATYALMLCLPNQGSMVHGRDASFGGHGAVEGCVVEAQSLHKRACFRLRQADGQICRVVSFHKVANLVRVGDHIAARGWRVEDKGRRLLLQFHSHRDNLVWFPNSLDQTTP